MSTQDTPNTTAPTQAEQNTTETDPCFNPDLIVKYPRSHRKVQVQVTRYTLRTSDENSEKGTTTHLSPHGIQFNSPFAYEEGALLKISLCLPNYWTRKQQFVDYARVDTPEDFRVLAKVVKTEDIGKRGKKKLITVQTVNIDEVDELVLKSFLQEG